MTNNKLEAALDAIRRGKGKGSKGGAWSQAETALFYMDPAAAKSPACYQYGDVRGWPDWEAIERAVRAALDSRPLIVTRHAGTVEWLARRNITGQVKAHVGPDDVEGRCVYGVLPFHLAALTASITVVDLPLLRPDQRGAELTADEMDAAGARLVTYTVTTTATAA